MKIQQNQLQHLKNNGVSADIEKEAKLNKACKDFEAIFIKQMLTTMRKSIPKGGLFDQGHEQEMIQSMYDDELAKSIAHGKGMGIADAMYKQMSGKVTTSTHQGHNNDNTK